MNKVVYLLEDCFFIVYCYFGKLMFKYEYSPWFSSINLTWEGKKSALG